MKALTHILLDLNIAFHDGSGHKHAREGWLQIDCPFCGKGSGKFHMGINKRGNYCSCWKCGRHTLVETVAESADVPFKQARALLHGLEGSASSGPSAEEKRGTLVLPKGRGPLLPIHCSYLRGRGFDPDELVRMWGIEGIGMAKKLSWRIFIPIHLDGEIVSWTTRAVKKDAELRYVSASAEQEKVNHKSILYGEDKCGPHACCVVEGPIGCWAIGPGTVATCGTGYSRAQLARLARFQRVGVCFDPEPEAQRRARVLADDLSAFGIDVDILQLEESEDPGAIVPRERKHIRRQLGLAA